MSEHHQAEHHRLAAKLLHTAATLHEKAADQIESGNHGLVAHFAHLAHGNTLKATEHANEAAKQHTADYSA